MKTFIASLTVLFFLLFTQFAVAGVCRPSCEGIKGACSCVIMDNGEKCCGSASDKLSSKHGSDTQNSKKSIKINN